MLYSTRARQPEQNCCTWRIFHETTRTDRLCAALVLVVAACGGGGVPVGLRRLGRRGRRPADHEGPVGRADRADQAELRRDQAQVPGGRDGRAGEPEDERDPVPDPGQRVPAGGRQARRQGRPTRTSTRGSTRSRSSTTATRPARSRRRPSRWRQRYQAALKQQGFTDEEVRQGIKLQLIREDVFKKVTGDVKVSDDEIKTYYDKNKQQYATPAQPREPRRPPHPRQDEGEGRPALRAAAGEPEQVRRARQEVLDRHLLGAERRQAPAGHGGQGPAGAAVREGRLLDQGERDLEAGALAVRLAHHRGARARSSRDAREADAARAGEGGDPAAAPLPGQAEGDGQVARRDQEALLQADRLPGGLRAAAGPGPVQAVVLDDVRRGHRPPASPWRSPRRWSSCKS